MIRLLISATPVTEKSGVKFRQNINELDTLLDDLNHTQKMELSSKFFTNTSSISLPTQFPIT